MRQLEFPENIQAIVGGKEYLLDNTVLKIWPESEETNGEYASAIRSFKHNLDIQKIHINFDIKDFNDTFYDLSENEKAIIMKLRIMNREKRTKIINEIFE